MRIVIDTEPLDDGPPPTDLHLMVGDMGGMRNMAGGPARSVEVLHRASDLDRRELRAVLAEALYRN